MGSFDLFGARLDNSMTVGAQAQIDREDAAAASMDQAEQAAYNTLHASMMTALAVVGAGAIVDTPAFGERRAVLPVVEAAIELAQYPEADWIEHELFQLAALAMASSDPAVKAAATAWANRVSDAHARLHAVDAAEATRLLGVFA